MLRHVLLLEVLGGLPIQMQFFRHHLNAGFPASSPHIIGKSFGVEGVVRQNIQLFPLHLAATPADHTANIEGQIDTGVPAGKIADMPGLAVIPADMSLSAAAANCFFERRKSFTSRALGSPKMPVTVRDGRKPGN